MIVDCPFSECSARIELVLEQAVAGDDETTTWRIPLHDLTPEPPGYGSCPASYMGHPLQAYERNVLGHEATKVRNRRANTEQNDRLRERLRDPEPPHEHSKTPHPDADPGPWFQGNRIFPDQNREVPRRPMGRLPIKEENREQGAAVASVAEVRMAIDQANQLMAEAMEANQSIDGKLAEAKGLVDWIRASSVDPLAAPFLSNAQEACGNIHQYLHLGIEANNTYAATL